MEDVTDFWRFVAQNAQVAPASLRLKYHGKGHELEIVQIECRKKFAKKLARTLEADPKFLFPSVLAGEQSTSDRLADYHCSLIAEGWRLCDLTSGLGIDALHMARMAAHVTAIDIDSAKTEALAYNAANMGIDNLTAVNADCTEYVKSYDGPRIDATFIDPARRADDGSRVYALSDCQPDVTTLLQPLSKFCNRLIVKASPMLDITNMANSLPGVQRIIALGTPTECKELIAVVNLADDDHREPEIAAVTLFDEGRSELLFTASEERSAKCDGSRALPQEGEFLYEPYPATMKAAPYNLLSQRYHLSQIHANTHLYFGNQLVDNFPGDVWTIERIITYESKNIKRLKKEYPRIMVSARNFDMSAEALRQKLGVKDGGDKRLMGVTLANNTRVMLIMSAAGHK